MGMIKVKDRAVVFLRMAERDKLAFLKAARIAGMTLNAFVLQCANNGLEVDRARRMPAADIKEGLATTRARQRRET
jgi:uncharacterized protein (DUF1778 family)